jgi:hypothetical protein
MATSKKGKITTKEASKVQSRADKGYKPQMKELSRNLQSAANKKGGKSKK